MYPQGSFRNPYSIYGVGDRRQTARQPSWAPAIPVSQTQSQPQLPPQSQQQRQQQQQQQPPKPEPKKEESKQEEPKKEEPSKTIPPRIISLPTAKPEAKGEPKKEEPTKPIPPRVFSFSTAKPEAKEEPKKEEPTKPIPPRVFSFSTPNPEAKEEPKKEEPTKPILPSRLLSSSIPKPEAKEEPKKEDQQKVANLEWKKEDPKPKTTLPPKELSPPRKSVLSETSKDEKLSIVPVETAEKPIVKAGSPSPRERSLQQGIKEDVADLTRKIAELNAGQQQKMGNNSQQDLGVRVITLAGENRGATMDFGPEGRKNENGFDIRGGRKLGEDIKNEESSDKKGNGRLGSKAGPVSAYVNSNVQAANNSILYNSTCPHRDPGVRLQLSNAPGKSKDAKEDKVKAIKPAKIPASF